ncbi:hypothetical protein MPSEU_000323300 [Mayamaea pseudoterrestris]|nr:hypothetical protein MPSEU_000323300 [Mayamaea pseudoterrestris]
MAHAPTVTLPVADATVVNESEADDSASHFENKDSKTDDETADNDSSCSRRLCKCLTSFYMTYDFLILAVLAILLAKAYPPLGAIYLAPEITATWVAVIIIFFLSGLNLKTEEFKNAFKQIGFNVYIQVYSFVFVSAFVFGVSRGLAKAGILSQDLADGLVICACLPMAINMVIVFTRAGNGDEAASIFNASFANLIGALVSPALILAYLGTQGNIDLLDVFYKLALRLLLPIAIGQIVRNVFKSVREFVTKYKWYIGKTQQYCLIFIIYTTFCKTFIKGLGASIGSIFILIAFEFLMLAGLMATAWYSLKLLFKDKPKLRVMGLFGCTQKTVAVGIPLISAMYGDNPAVGLYTLPLIIWHTMQLVIGTALMARLSAFVKSEEERLGIADTSTEEVEAEDLTSAGAEEGDLVVPIGDDKEGSVKR